MTHVFISYAHKDREFTEELKRQIEDAGFDHWTDSEKLQGGQNWEKEIRKAIETAYAIIVIKSPASYRSQYVTSEWTCALCKGVPIIPVLHKRQKTTHAWLEVIQHLDFTNVAKQPWAELIRLLDEQRNQHGIRIRVPSNAPPNVRIGLDKLNSPFPADNIDGAELLGNLKDPMAVPGLVITLGHDDNRVWNAALDALVKFGDPVVAQLLEELLKPHDNENIQLWIGVALGRMKSDTALSALLEATHDASGRTRYFAVHGLGEMQRIEAVPRLLELVDDSQVETRTEAIGILVQIGEAKAISGLLKALRHADKDTRAQAAEGLGNVGDATAVSGLLDALRDSEASVRATVARALGRIRDPSVIKVLFSLSLDQDGAVRQAVLDALNLIGTPEAMELVYKWPKP